MTVLSFDYKVARLYTSAALMSSKKK